MNMPGRTHVMLVSAQAAPNLLPALDPALAPSRAILLTTRSMKPRAQSLSKVLRERGIEAVIRDLPDEHSYDSLLNSMLELRGELGETEVFLNLTGGTKLMALAAAQMIADPPWRPFYVDVDTDEVIFLSENQGRKPMELQLRLPHYLASYGVQLESRTEPRSWTREEEDVIGVIVSRYADLEGAIGRLNWLASLAHSKRQLWCELDAEHRRFADLGELLRQFELSRFLQVKDSRLSFRDESSLEFCRGGWLELLVAQRVQGARSELGIRDVAWNAQLVSNGVRNEMDLAFLANNRLHVIECKTISTADGGADRANEALFKLVENLRRLGGLASKGMLVSYRTLRPSELHLARVLGVEVVQGPGIQHLNSKLRAWVRPTRIG